MPTSPFTGTQSNEPWFFSSCGVKDISEVTICRDVSLSHRPVTGMLLRYASGHRACLGQFRFNMALEEMQIKDGGVLLHIGSRRTAERYMYVAEVTVQLPPDRGEASWIHVHQEDG